MATIAEATPDGRLTVWSATQVPHYLHRSLSEVLGIPMHRIRVIKPEVGGGFGGKSDPLPHEIVCAALAIETGRPVKILFDREDVFLTNHGRHPTQNDIRIATDADGIHPGLRHRGVDRRRRLELVRHGHDVLQRGALDGSLPCPELPLPGPPGLHDQAPLRGDARPRRHEPPLLDRGRARPACRGDGDRPVRPARPERAPPELDDRERVPHHVHFLPKVPRRRARRRAGGTRSSGSSPTAAAWGSAAGSTSRGRTARSISPRRCPSRPSISRSTWTGGSRSTRCRPTSARAPTRSSR